MPHPGLTSSPVAFLGDFLITGAVGGADASSTPAEVTALLGDEFTESGDTKQRLRSYRIVEFAWQRTAPEDPWDGLYVMAQAHRLEVPVPVDDLADHLRQAGFPIVEVAPDGLGCRRFVREDSRTGLLADENTGAVLKVSAPTWFGTGPRHAEPAWSREAGKSWVNHLVALDPGEREQWAVRRQPESGAERARWWWFLLVACRQRVPEGPDGTQAPWTDLALWLVTKCRAAGVLDRTEAALQIAGHSLLPPDETVRMCLDAIPVSRAEVATRDTTPYAPERLVAINRSRQAKALALAAGAQLRRGVRDPGLRAETEAWLELRRTLM
ncbi:hypothetical protein GCM10009647_080940 [Streptomyces sanglieri]|uniref:Nucleotidyltransferase n=1 Tax=Streptomyces sanglieri TaxID=193460 RepID=A0ABW2X1T4_9ACTN|nr:hypothetical protein [Streptomyces sp. Wh19]MDV9200853.1 hypothetical protein [Streptomyces sp. Wh19]